MCIRDRATTTRINTDFTLEQKLDFITKGLNFRGTISWDKMCIRDRGKDNVTCDTREKLLVTYYKVYMID